MVCCDIACISIQRIDHCFKKIGYEIQLCNQPFEQFVDMYVLVNRYSGKFYFVCMIYQIIISKLQTKNCPIRPYHVPISEFKPPITCTAFSTWIHVRLFIWLFSMRSNAFVFLECIKIAFLYIFGLQACYMDVRASYSHGIWFLHSDTDSLTGQSLVCPAFDTKSAYQHDFKIFN